ncbi:MAG: hypothetical protein GX868_17225 [Actinobacteria bacterium]|nr:hypothetical protein [Actinomycetota bacterium]
MTRIFRTTDSETPVHRRAAGAVVVAACALVVAAPLSGCGDSTPTREEFIAELRTTMGSDLTDGTGLAVDADALRGLVDDFLGCTYDAISGDPDLLRQMLRDPSFSSATTDTGAEQQATLSQLTADCTTALNNAAAEVPSGEE